MSPLDRKLFRDLGHLKGQVLAIALVIGVRCRAADHVAGRARVAARDHQRLLRALPLRRRVRRSSSGRRSACTTRVADIPGVQYVESRIIAARDRGRRELPRARSWRISCRSPTTRHRCSIASCCAPAACPPRVKVTSAVLNEPLRPGARPSPGRHAARDSSTAGARRCAIVGTALSPEFIYAIRPGVDDAGQSSLRRASGSVTRASPWPAYDFEGAFNDVTLTLRAGADAEGVIAAISTPC